MLPKQTLVSENIEIPEQVLCLQPLEVRKVNNMKAICRQNGNFVGLIPDIETYNKVKAGKAHWKETKYSRMEGVQIPVELFEKLPLLDNEMQPQKRINMYDRLELVNNARVKAIKEFAQLFAEEFFVGGVTYSITKEEFESFVKEKVGEIK